MYIKLKCKRACNILTACFSLIFFRKHKFTIKEIFWEISVKLNGTAIDILNNNDSITLYGLGLLPVLHCSLTHMCYPILLEASKYFIGPVYENS